MFSICHLDAETINAFYIARITAFRKGEKIEISIKGGLFKYIMAQPHNEIVSTTKIVMKE